MEQEQVKQDNPIGFEILKLLKGMRTQEAKGLLSDLIRAIDYKSIID